MLRAVCEANNARTGVAHTAVAPGGLSRAGYAGLPAVTVAGGARWRGLGGAGGAAGGPGGRALSWLFGCKTSVWANPLDLDGGGRLHAYCRPVSGRAVAGHGAGGHGCGLPDSPVCRRVYAA